MNPRTPPSELDAAARHRAREIAQSAPLALESIRATTRLGLAEQVREAMIREQAEQQAPLAPPTPNEPTEPAHA